MKEIVVDFTVVPLLPSQGETRGVVSFPRVAFESRVCPFLFFAFLRRGEGVRPWAVLTNASFDPQWTNEFPRELLEEELPRELRYAVDPLQLALFLSELEAQVAELMPAVRRWFRLFPRDFERLTESQVSFLESSARKLLPVTITAPLTVND